MGASVEAILLLVLAATVGAEGYGRRYYDATRAARHQLAGWARLDHTYRHPGPTSGQFIDGKFGVEGPFVGAQPVPGFSALLTDGAPGAFIGMPDNGFGGKGNSGDFVVGFYRIDVDFKREGDGTSSPGGVTVKSFTAFNDRNRVLDNGVGVDLLITADLAHYRNGSRHGADSGIAVDRTIREGRLLTGYDLDVESMTRAADGTFWVGEEFGPYLLHFDVDGTLLEEPVPHPVLRSPFNPTSLAQPATTTHPSSRGLEALVADESGKVLYTVPEAAPAVDELRAVPGDERVVEIYEFDTTTSRYTGVAHKYRKDGPATDNKIVIGDMTRVGDVYVLVERDNFYGDKAELKRVYTVDFRVKDADGVLKKRLLVDLLDITDKKNIGGGEAQQQRPKSSSFAMPFDSIECLVPVDDRTLAVAVDSNFPSQDGRETGVPDSTEIVEIRFRRPIDTYRPRNL